MSDKPHLLIPGAAPPAEAEPAPARGPDPVPEPALPNLRALLTAMVAESRIECDDDSPAMPFELALAHLHGLPGVPGYIPWAAFETATMGAPCAWVRPCHWRVGSDHLLLTPPEDLALDESASRTLLAAMDPYFREDGIALAWRGGSPGAWLACGEPLRGLRTISTDRAAGRRLTPAVFDGTGAAAATLRRLQNEMQMLLYTHPVNELRHRQGLVPVNSFWVTGAGVLDSAPAPQPGVAVEHRLRAAALQRDGAAHAQAWREVDATACAGLLTRLRGGEPVRLTLCGERAAQTFAVAPTGFQQRISGLFRRVSISRALHQL